MNYIKYMSNRLKLKGMPKVYYFNLDSDTDRKYFMESQFKNYGIKYERVSQSCYTAENFYDWVYRIEDHDDIINEEIDYPGICEYSANFLRHLDLMNWWLNTTNEEYLLVMEDDYDLSLIDYWHFSWKYLIKRLPPDWDAFRLNDDHMTMIKFFIHPVNKEGFLNFGAMLFKRSFVIKILTIYNYWNGKVKVRTNDARFFSANPYCVDNAFTQIGSVYTAPLITTESSFCKEHGDNSSKYIFEPIQKACHQWWRNERDLFTLDDFFCYGKPYDEKMSLVINRDQRV